MQSSSHEMSTPQADKRICEYMPKKFLCLHWDHYYSGLRYPTGVKSAGFQFLLEASRVFCPTEQLWYNKTVCQWMTMYATTHKKKQFAF